MKEVLTPLSDKFMINAFNIRFTLFRIGPMSLELFLKDTKFSPPHIAEMLGGLEDHQTNKVLQNKRYIIIGIVNETETYFLGQYDTKEESWGYFNNMINKLKYGEQVELNDQLHLSFPLRLSYKGIEWIW